MGYNFPWTNMHDLNLDWLLDQVKQLAEAVKTIPRKTSQLINDAGFITSATFPVSSVNNKTGAVVLNASDVGALPNTYTPPVIKVNNRTGSITITDIMTRAANQATAYPTTSGAWSVATNIFANLTPASYYGILTIENNGNYQRHIFTNLSGQVFVGWTDNANTTEPATWSCLTETSEDLYFCTYNTTTNAQIEAALAANKIPVLLYSDTLYVFDRRVSTTNHYFCAVHSTSSSSNYYYARCNSNAWTSGSGTLARLASPTFTGTPKAPTASAGDNTTQLATTAFVQQEISANNTWTALTRTYTTQSYVTETDFNRNFAYSDGRGVYFYFNLNVSTSPTGAFQTIGSFTLPTNLPRSLNMTVASQNNDGNLAISVLTTGTVQIYSYGTASGYYRTTGYMPF